MIPNGEHLKADSSASPSEGKRLTQTTVFGDFSSVSDGYQHWCGLWEKRPGRKGSFQSDRLPGHREVTEHHDHRAQRPEQHQRVRLLLPQHPRECPLPGRRSERTQITAEVGLRGAVGDPTQVLVPTQPWRAALPGAAGVWAADVPVAGGVVVFLSRVAAQHLRTVVRTCVEVCSPYRRYWRSKEVWAFVCSAQLSGNAVGCGCHHLHCIYNRQTDPGLTCGMKGVRLLCLNFIWSQICTEE